MPHAIPQTHSAFYPHRFVCHPKILHKHCLQFLLGVKMAPRETENNAYAKFWGDKQRALWYVMVFLEWSIHDSLVITVLDNCYYNFRQVLQFTIEHLGGNPK